MAEVTPIPGLVIRRIAAREQPAIQAFVQSVVDETYAFVWPSGAPPIDATGWTAGWLAEARGQTVAVMLTGNGWLDDLWVIASHRRQGIGSALLAQAEAEIAASGHATARLRVVAGNGRALRFYLDHGWKFQDQQAHERLPISMITLAKILRTNHSAAKQ